MTTIKHSATLDIGSKMAGSWAPTVSAIVGGTDRIKKGIASVKDEQAKLTKQIKETESASKRLGIDGSADVAKLRREHERLDGVLFREKKRLENIKSLHAIGGKGVGAVKGIASDLASVGRYAAYATAGLGTFAGGLAGWFTSSAIEATASLEQMRTSLETLQGTEGAKKSLSWITDFAAKTPYELAEVQDAFVRLKVSGMDPMDGTLKTLGDTASAMSKPVMLAVEAMKDAVVGENERLKEFGIRASTAGNKITYFYKNAAGQDAKKTVNKNSQEMIKATLLAIWNEKYAGGMEKQSRTWKGLVSNLKDQWTQFQVRVMEGGVFDMLKGELEGLLASVNTWASDGTLERWAGDIREAYRTSFAAVKDGFSWTRDNWPQIKQAFTDGWQTVKDLASGLAGAAAWARDMGFGVETLAKGLALVAATKAAVALAPLVSSAVSLVGWLIKANSLTVALQASGTAKGAALAIGGAGAAGAVAAGGLIGYGIGTGINELSANEKGERWSDRIGNWMSSDVDKRREELFGKGDGKLHPDTRKLQSARGAAPVVNNITNRPVINMSIDAKGADADEVAEKVSRKLWEDMQAKGLASYG